MCCDAIGCCRRPDRCDVERGDVCRWGNIRGMWGGGEGVLSNAPPGGRWWWGACFFWGGGVLFGNGAMTIIAHLVPRYDGRSRVHARERWRVQ
jgi:hypothetical protein